MQSKIAGIEILLISETWFSFYRRHPPEVFYKKGVLKIFAIFTGKQLCQSLFVSYSFIKKEKKRLWQRGFPVNFARFLRTPFFTEHSG